MPVDTLLKSLDCTDGVFLRLPFVTNGQQVTMPFVLALAFSTNLNQKKLAILRFFDAGL